MFEFMPVSGIIRKFPARYGRSFLHTETDENDPTCFILAQLRVIRQAIDILYGDPDKKALEIRAIEQSSDRPFQ